MKEKKIKIDSLDKIDEAAKEFIKTMGDSTVFTFKGDMGAGKTTFISAVVRGLGVNGEEANSPSFAIANEYRSETTAELMYHFDLYRLESLEEIMDIGFEDYLDSGALCFVEWPEKVMDILPDDTVHVEIKANDDQTREVVLHLQE